MCVLESMNKKITNLLQEELVNRKEIIKIWNYKDKLVAVDSKINGLRVAFDISYNEDSKEIELRVFSRFQNNKILRISDLSINSEKDRILVERYDIKDLPLLPAKIKYLLNTLSERILERDVAHIKIKKRIKEKLKNGETVRVGFFVSDSTKWNSDKLFHRMLDSKYYNPSIVVFSSGRSIKDKETKLDSFKKDYKYYEDKLGEENVISGFDPKQDKNYSSQKFDFFDIIFVQQPWGGLSKVPEKFLKKSLIAYMHYGYVVTDNPKLHYHKQGFHDLLWRYYAQSQIHYDAIQESNSLLAESSVVVGYPKLDIVADFRIKEKSDGTNTRIIYAPHHTIGPHGNVRLGTFDWSYQVLAELREENRDILWTYKPHGRLKYTAADFMGYTKYLSYAEAWESSQNSKTLEGSDYLEEFHNSDMLITDCGSFLGEYMFTGAPILRLVPRHKHVPFNKVGKSIDDVCYHASTASEVKRIFHEVIIENNDWLREKRLELRNKLFSDGFDSSASIMKDLDASLGIKHG